MAVTRYYRAKYVSKTQAHKALCLYFANENMVLAKDHAEHCISGNPNLMLVEVQHLGTAYPNAVMGAFLPASGGA